MFDQTVQQLANPDPAIRRKAIIALGTIGDARALGPLANTFKTDTDPALRELALKAGRHIKGLAVAAPHGAALASPVSTPPPAQNRMLSNSVDRAAAPVQYTLPPSSVSLATMPDALPEKGSPIAKPVSEQTRQSARRKLDSAIDMMSRGDNEKALTMLTEAVRMDPKLAENSLAQNVAASITGMDSSDEAMAMIAERAVAPKKGKGGNAAKPGESAASSVGADSDTTQFALMIVAMFVILLILGFVGRYWIMNNIDLLLQSSRVSQSSTRTYDPALMKTTLTSMLSTGNILIFGVVGTIATVFSIAVLFGVGTLMGGSGSLFRFMNALLQIQVVQSVLTLIGIGILAFISYKAMPAATIKSANSAVNSAFSLVSLGALCWEVYAISRNHEVSIIRAIVILIASSIATGCIGGIFVFFVISQVTSQLVGAR